MAKNRSNIPAYRDSCFSTTVLLAPMGYLSLLLRFVIDSDHRLSRSSSELDPVQSSVAPPLDDEGTGCGGMTPTEGLKSISDSMLPPCVPCTNAAAIGWGGSLARTGDDWVENEELEALSEVNGRGLVAVRVCSAFIRASRRACRFSAR